MGWLLVGETLASQWTQRQSHSSAGPAENGTTRLCPLWTEAPIAPLGPFRNIPMLISWLYVVIFFISGQSSLITQKASTEGEPIYAKLSLFSSLCLYLFSFEVQKFLLFFCFPHSFFCLFPLLSFLFVHLFSFPFPFPLSIPFLALWNTVGAKLIFVR